MTRAGGFGKERRAESSANSRLTDHYHQQGLEDTLLDALRQTHGSLDDLTVRDLSPVDGFHVRGRKATEELAPLAGVREGWEVLDLGSGLGGSARHLAVQHECRVVGLDLTPTYVALAETLSRLVGLGETTRFQVGSATALPFSDDSFDCVWMEHVQMNIADKAGMVAEIARVLRPGGRLAMHEVFSGAAEQPHFPVPWASGEAMSFMLAPEAFRSLLDERRFRVVAWRDVTGISRDWFRRQRSGARTSGPPPLGIHLVLGSDAPAKVANLSRSLEEERVRIVQLVAEKP